MIRAKTYKHMNVCYCLLRFHPRRDEALDSGSTQNYANRRFALQAHQREIYGKKGALAPKCANELLSQRHPRQLNKHTLPKRPSTCLLQSRSAATGTHRPAQHIPDVHFLPSEHMRPTVQRLHFVNPSAESANTTPAAGRLATPQRSLPQML